MSRRSESSGGRLMVPILTGTLIVGMSFVGIALASQRRVTEPSSSPSSGIVEASRSWLIDVAAPKATTSPESLPASKPVAIDIGAIDVHSDLNEVGLDPGGAIETPAGSLYNEAAWYRHSPMPGRMGPSIIVGHVDSAENGPSVFFRLGELQPGNRISIQRADGSRAVFVVDLVRQFEKDEFPTKLVYGDIGHAGLRLITCGGRFDSVGGHYQDNIVVFASLEQARP